MTPVNIVNLCIVLCIIVLGNRKTVNARTTKQNECTDNYECTDHERCINNHCFDACSFEKCAIRGEPCGAINHTATCTCSAGFQPNKDGVCEPSCVSDESCGQNAECTQVGTRMKCQCKPGYYIDPYAGTECMQRRSCKTKEDCTFFEICEDGICNVKCANNKCLKKHEKCFPTDDGEQCVCKSGYKYDLNNDCMQFECRFSSDCAAPKMCELVYGMHLCVCPYGFVLDYSNNTIANDWPCRQRCHGVFSCPLGQWCRGDVCVECDGIMCRERL